MRSCCGPEANAIMLELIDLVYLHIIYSNFGVFLISPISIMKSWNGVARLLVLLLSPPLQHSASFSENLDALANGVQ